MEDNECVFHGDRFVFDAFVRDMRKAGFINRSYANVMAMTVCTCRRNATHRGPISEQQIREAADHVIQSTNHSFRALPRNALELVTSAAHIALHNPMTSQGRLTVVISQALLGDVTLLKEERAAANASKKEPDDQKKTKARGKPGTYIVQLMIQKKKRKLPVKTTFTIPVFGGSTRQLFDKDLVGQHFCKLCVKHRCVLELDLVETARKMATNEPLTYIKAWCSSDVALNDVKEILTSLARGVQAESTRINNIRKARKMAIIEHWKRVELMANEKPAANSQKLPLLDPQGYKEVLSRDFEDRAYIQKKVRQSKQKTKSPVQREDGSTYVEGHCLHCLMPFRDFKTGGDDVKECRHHPGYVTKDQWTCCQETCDSGHPSHKEHAQKGCTVSRHSWRPHKKAARGKRVAMNCISDNVLQHRPARRALKMLSLAY